MSVVENLVLVLLIFDMGAHDGSARLALQHLNHFKIQDECNKNGY